MKNLVFTALLYLSIVQQSASQLPKSQKKDKLNISFNKNIELLGFAYFIAFEGSNSETKILEINGQEVLEKDWQNYGFHFYQQYKHFANNTNLNVALGLTEHLWLSNIIPLLLQTESFPNAQLSPEIDEAFYLAFSPNKNPEDAKQRAIKFLNACNNFYNEVKFDEYLLQSKTYYEASIEQILDHIPTPDFILFAEKFYRKSFDHYSLIPSLTIPKGMGFGPRYTNKGGTHVFNVFGALDYQVFLDTASIDMGFGNKSRLRELSVHEFGHSFVNPEIEKVPQEIIQQTSSLFGPLREAMEAQGYNTWESCLIEHFVRAGEVIVAEIMEDTLSAERLKDDYIQKRKFVYLPIILEELHQFNTNTSDTYLAMVNRVLQNLSIQADSLQKANIKASVFSSNPRDAKFHTEDIAQFWKLFDQLGPKLSGEALQSEYIDKGSIGLKGFVKNRIESGKNLSRVVRKEMDYYQYIRPFTLTIDEKKEQFYIPFENLKKIYPNAVFPDVYFVVGANNTGGSIFDKGLIIGAERFGKPSASHKPPLDIEDLDKVVAHELIHFQQNYIRNNSLLAQAIREGAADFICELIAGGHSSNKEMYTYGENHKKKLWQEFKSKMDQNDWTGWLYYQKDKSRPKDLGYWMGYKICKSYYQHAMDKDQAIYEILNIQDFKKFLELSKFDGE